METGIVFLHSTPNVGLNSTNSVGRLTAAYSYLLGKKGVDVVVITQSITDIEGVRMVPVKPISSFNRYSRVVQKRLFKHEDIESNISDESLQSALATLDASKKWVVITSRLPDLAGLINVNAKLPIILWTHSYGSPQSIAHYLYKKKSIYGWIFPTEALYKVFASGLMDKGIWAPVFVIPNINESASFDLQKTQQQPQTDKVKMLFLGGDNPIKGYHQIIYAILSAKHDKKLEVNILGCRQVKTLRHDENTVINFLPKQSRENVMQYIAESDIGLVPSTCFENAPTALIEMASAGLYILASKAGGIAEIIFNAGELVDEFDFPEVWANKLSNVLENIAVIKSKKAIG